MKIKAKVMICDNRFVMRTIERKDIEILRKWKNLHKDFFFNKNEISMEEQIGWYNQFSQKVDDHMFLIEAGNDPVGCIGARIFDDFVDVYNVILGDKNYLGQHVMRSAMLAIISFADKLYSGRSIKVRVLLSNPAIKWYEKTGFIITEYLEDYVLMQYNGIGFKDTTDFLFDINNS